MPNGRADVGSPMTSGHGGSLPGVGVGRRMAAVPARAVDRLVDTINNACGEDVPPSEIVRRLMHSVVAHRGATWRDDAMVVMVTWRPDAVADDSAP